MASKKPIDENNVSIFRAVPEAGIVYYAPKGTAIPTGFTKPAELDEAYVSLGDLGEDGFTESVDSEASDFKDVRGHIVLTVSNGKTRTYKFNFIEVQRAETAKLHYGNVETNEDGSIKHIELNSDDDPEYVFVIYELMSDDTMRMTVLDRGKATDFEDVSHQRGELESYTPTVTALDNGGKVGDIWTAVAA